MRTQFHTSLSKVDNQSLQNNDKLLRLLVLGVQVLFSLLRLHLDLVIASFVQHNTMMLVHFLKVDIKSWYHGFESASILTVPSHLHVCDSVLPIQSRPQIGWGVPRHFMDSNIRRRKTSAEVARGGKERWSAEVRSLTPPKEERNKDGYLAHA